MRSPPFRPRSAWAALLLLLAVVCFPFQGNGVLARYSPDFSPEKTAMRKGAIQGWSSKSGVPRLMPSNFALVDAAITFPSLALNTTTGRS